MTHPPRTLTAAEEMRLCAGFAAQPFVGALIAFVTFPVLQLGRPGFTPDGISAAAGIALATAIFAVPATLVVAVPTAIWVLKRRAVTLPTALSYGLAFGNVATAINVLSGDLPGVLRTGIVGSLIGASCAAAFWAISIRGRDFSRDPDVTKPDLKVRPPYGPEAGLDPANRREG